MYLRSIIVTEGDDDDIDDDEVLDFDDFTKPLSTAKRISNSIVPLAASIGFVATPSPKLAVKVGGAVAGGIAGLATKVAVIDKLVKEEEEREFKNSIGGGDGGGEGSKISPEVESLLKRLKAGPPLNTYTLKKLEGVARKAGLPGNLLAELFTHVFSEVVLKIVQNGSTDVTELEEAMEFAEVMDLTEYEIKDGLTIAAIKLGKQLKKDKAGFYQSTLPKNFLLHGAKLFFLSNKMMGTSQGYYGKRMSAAMVYLPDEMMKTSVTDACTKLFIRCIDSVLSNPSDFTPLEVTKFMEFLTVTPDVSDLRPATMQDMIMSALTKSLENSLGEDAVKNAMDVNVDNYENLQAARECFGWEPLEFDRTVETKTIPVFQAAAKTLVQDCMDNPEKAEEFKRSLHERMDALNIDKKKARIMLTTLISDSNNRYMSEIDSVYNISGGALEPTFKMMAAYCTTHDALKAMVSDLMESSDVPLPGLPFADMVKVSMFEMQQIKKDSRVSDDMFALNEEQREIVLKSMALPKVASWINQCINELNYSPDAKAAYEKLLKEKGVDDQQWAATAIDFYYQEVDKTAKMSAIPSSTDMDRLKKLKEFLGCSETLVAKVNLELLGDKYMKAVKESMMPSGFIQPEYVDGLERLRNRLGISKADSEKLLGVTTRSHVGEVVKKLIDQWKADTGAIERKDEAKKKDKSGDPIESEDNILGYMETGANVMETGGPNVFMREALNLVDHVIENYQASQDVNLTTKNDLPVTAVGYASEEELFEIYRHFIVTRLTERDPELKKRYTDVEDFFARILGLSSHDQAKCKQTFLYSTYKRMLKQAFQFKENLDTNDLKQFAYLKDALSMDEETCERILNESSKGAVLEYTASIMRPKGNLITADVARKLRGHISSLSLDMRKDIGLNPNVISFMYTLEVQAAIEDGYESEIQDLQESYGIPEETAAYIVDVASKRYISQLLSIGLSYAKKYEEAQSNSITENIVKFMYFFDGPLDADGNLFDEDDKERLIAFYRDNADSQRNDDQKREDCIRLKELINLSDDFIAPIEGIAGLKGETKTDRSATGMMM